MYETIKLLHILLISLTFILFLVNFGLTLKGSELVNHKALKITPHALYTLFLLTFVYLIAVNPLGLYPGVSGWATAKLAGFIFYVLSITLALKWAKKLVWRIVGFVSAVFWLFMTAKLAFSAKLKVKHLNEETGLIWLQEAVRLLG